MDTQNPPLILAITACPTGIAHTYMAAEKLQAAARESGVNLKVETHGSIGVEGTFSADDIAQASAIIIAADVAISQERFAGKRVLSTAVDEAIKNPQCLLERAPEAPVLRGGAHDGGATDGGGAEEREKATSEPHEKTGAGARERLRTMYQALMNGVSHMIPFVVTGGLLLAVALSVGGQPTAEGLVIPEGSFWATIEQLGALALSLMVPVLSAYIAAGIAQRPGLAPGFITGMVAVTGSLYGSEAGAGFIGGIITGILSGYVALGIKRIPVNKYVAPIWPIIVIPISTSLIVGLLFIYVIGHPVAALFESLMSALQGLDGGSAILLGAVIGGMIAFDMGGPFNKTAFLFGGGLIAAGNPYPMGMAAAAISVPPLAVGVATLLRRGWFSSTEREAGAASLVMGFFGISEGAIPLAAARPLQVIPANVLGGAVAGALAGWWSVADHVMHGGPIVAVLGALDGVGWFFLALAAGVAVTAATIVIAVGVTQPQERELLTERAVLLNAQPRDREHLLRLLIDAAGKRISRPEEVLRAALDREEKSTTAVGEGVAIPHARCSGVREPVLAVARLERDVEWNAPDGQPVRLVFLIAVPEDAGKQHLKILARIARALTTSGFREDLLNAENKRAVVARVTSVLPPKEGSNARALVENTARS
ncbi:MULTISPECIES: fructose-specific PTS transporter subunit EIIC [unclassified Corynebacterium]|uniref:fructose-specific PTS transporter subunit EIIC n=1 Tax=unclassified Corynebacterium TaxID=2624378 RepID=UPI0029C9B7AC|nr:MULTISPECIES: fructose-specific PTS transporter subunit EIIC [unclassified Corynebacterium]WPF65922.1 fructose-specific PTS transporter subunit EIIC [Corynebacterium sp. 22KM0430]WPF68415.1 fructose-specific PTS transporter subunit EIIC [Corynebacterium sp. 21KM1197]